MIFAKSPAGRVAVVFLLYLALCLGLYWNVLGGKFLQDDITLISDNPSIQSLAHVPSYFTTNTWARAYTFPEVSAYYRPLQALSFAVDFALWKLNPPGFHLTNVLIHAACCFLLFLLVRALSANVFLSFTAGLLFACHPLHAESVAFISGRSESLMAFFALAALLFSLRYREKKNDLFLAGSLLAYSAGLLVNETMLLKFFPLFLLVAAFRRETADRRFIFEALCLAGVSAIYAALRIFFIVPIQSLPPRFLSFPQELLNVGNLVCRSLALLLFPLDLHALRTYQPLLSLKSAAALAVIACAVFLAAFSVLLFRKKHRLPLLGILWFACAHGFLFFAMYKSVLMLTLEEHWLYLPSAGFFIFLAWMLSRIRGAKAAFAAGLVCAVWAALTVAGNAHWKDRIGYYTYNIRFHPRMALMRMNLAAAYSEKGMYGPALRQLDTAETDNPSLWGVPLRKGDVFRRMGRFDDAERQYRRALEIDSLCWQAVGRLKSLYAQQGREFIDRADPALAPQEQKVIVALRAGDFGKALGLAEENLRAGDSAGSLTLLGIVYGKLGLYTRAEGFLLEALKRDPAFTPALVNLAVVYERQGKMADADRLFSAAARKGSR